MTEVYGISRAAQRHRPDDSDLAQARQLQRMIDMIGSEDEAATELAITPLRAKKLLALLTADPKVQTAVAHGMSLDAAAKLAKLPRSEQVAKLAEIAATGEKPTARRVENKLREGSGKAPVESHKQRITRALVEIAKRCRQAANPEERDSLNEVAAILDPKWVAVDYDEDFDSTRPRQPAAQEAEFGA